MIILSLPALLPKGTIAFTVWPFIIVRDEEVSDKTLNHEKIHAQQQKECIALGLLISFVFHFMISISIGWWLLFSFLFFYVLYFTEYAIRRIQTGTWKEAYYNISFERESYLHEANLTYLEHRRHFAWTEYLKKI